MSGTVFAWVFFLVAALLYFLPSFVAFRRRHHQRVPILLVNLFLGATGLGWLAALVWSFTHIPADAKAH